MVELLMACVILGVVMSALLMTLQIGELANGIGSAKVDLESEVRMLVDWISKDIRQAKIQDLASTGNDPSTDHIKFRFWQWNSTSHSQEYLSNKAVQYTYDSGTKNLSREFWDVNGSVFYQNFTDISMAPFYTSYTDETTNDFVGDDLRENRRLIVVIRKDKTVRNRPLNFTMSEEVRIRNE